MGEGLSPHSPEVGASMIVAAARLALEFVWAGRGWTGHNRLPNFPIVLYLREVCTLGALRAYSPLPRGTVLPCRSGRFSSGAQPHNRPIDIGPIPRYVQLTLGGFVGQD